MAKTVTVKSQEDFIVQMNGDYNVVFSEFVAPKALVSGEVASVSGVWFIAAAPAASGAWVRGMSRGNPTTVNARALTGLTAEGAKAALEAQGIVFVDA